MNAHDLFEAGMQFHGHKCPAMPMGLRAGLAAMDALGVEHSRDKELHVVSETGAGHVAGCFVDGIMTATGCTYGKSNIQKLYYNKMAFTLIDTLTGRSIRVSLKPSFFNQVLNSPFVLQRRAGVLPQNIPSEDVDFQVEKILNLAEENFLEIGEIQQIDLPEGEGMFDVKPCARCWELTFVNKLQDSADGLICIPCAAEK
ncbi:FmdE family protein [Geopsychrobacter electrodiphilus]|uniref:FmdE family protein n=1 Tax=Geopsychrobacter electrodiphilus TaxID=225196 RepID=UPI00036D5F12|nr:FmdE family protein [Geopsychrobacter electrodiphilus]